MVCSPTPTSQLAEFYGDMSSLERILAALTKDGVDVDHLRARDVYSRELDCHNLGAYPMLERLAALVSEIGAPGSSDGLLDVGCGLGGPGRYLADRFGCQVLGVDLLSLRVEIARALTNMTGMADRVGYRIGDATRLPVEDRSFAAVWMLDVSVHIRAKQKLFNEVARVLRPGGHFVMHDQMTPIPAAMEPLSAHTPFFASSLPQLIVHVESAGLRVLAWRETTEQVAGHFRQQKARHEARPAPSDGEPRPWRERTAAQIEGYLKTLGELGGRTGVLIARRVDAPTAVG